jgi:uncharacterized iron-regulated membrane protein
MTIQSLVKRLRQFRSLHRWVGITVVTFLVITAFTGLLLGWKKNVEVLQPPTLKGTSAIPVEWVSFETLSRNATRAIDSVTHEANTIDRLDVRMERGLVKVLFTQGYWEVQLDLHTGAVLSVARRHSDWIEHIHDGSIVSDGFKLLYTSYLGLGLLLLTLTGFFLWYGPKLVRDRKGA